MKYLVGLAALAIGIHATARTGGGSSSKSLVSSSSLSSGRSSSSNSSSSSSSSSSSKSSVPALRQYECPLYSRKFGKPKRPGKHTKLLTINGSFDMREAAKVCWKHGYHLAALDKLSVKRVAKIMGRGKAVWFRHAFIHKGGNQSDTAFILKTRAKSNRASVHKIRLATAIKKGYRLSALCQFEPKQGHDVFRREERRPYCNHKRKVCLLGNRDKKCLRLCPLGLDVLTGEKPATSLGRPTSRYYQQLRVKQKDPSKRLCFDYEKDKRRRRRRPTKRHSSSSSSSSSSNGSSYSSYGS